MKFVKVPSRVEAVTLKRVVRGVEIGRATLIVGYNTKGAWGFLEDVFVEDEHRGKGIGKALIAGVIAEAKRRGCYKLIANSRSSREQVHAMYLGAGFVDWGKEFRLDVVLPGHIEPKE